MGSGHDRCQESVLIWCICRGLCVDMHWSWPTARLDCRSRCITGSHAVRDRLSRCCGLLSFMILGMTNIIAQGSEMSRCCRGLNMHSPGAPAGCTIPLPQTPYDSRRKADDRYSVVPALLDRLTHALGVLSAVVLVEIRGLDVGGRRGVGVVQETADGHQACGSWRHAGARTFGCS